MTPSLNIGLLSQEYPPHTNWGGMASYYEVLARELVRLGHRVVVVSRFDPGAPTFHRDPDGIDVWRVGSRLLRRQLVGRTIDRILHARAVNRKVLELDAVSPFDALDAAELGLDGERLLRDPAFARRMVVQCHGGNAFGQATDGLLGLPNRLDFAWSFRRELAAFHRVPLVVVPSEATRRNLLAYGVAPEKLTCIHHGIDTDRFSPPTERPDGRPLTVGFVGRLETTKGIDFVWKAIAAIGPGAGIRFRLKGAIHPEWKRDTVRKLEQFSSFVEHVPPTGPDEMPAFYHTLDVLLQPSRFENFGLAYVEAMASGLILFAGEQGAGPEIVADGVSGFLVDPEGAADPVVERLRTIAASPASYDSMRLAARANVVRRFSIRQCAQQKIDAYLGLIAAP